MIVNRFQQIFTGCLLFFLLSCAAGSQNEQQPPREGLADPLPSWNEGEVKSAILSYVKAVTDPAGQDFIPVQERIATIDNDGTLWSEQPVYFQFFFAMDRIKELAKTNPDLGGKEPYRSILNDDLKGALQGGEKGLLEIVMKSHSGISKAEFEKEVNQWMSTATHPTKNRLFKELVFVPMIELIHYLQAHQFEVFIVSGGGIDFVRAWAEEIYQIPKHQVIGSSLKSEYQFQEGKPQIIKMAEIDLIDDKEGKPIGIDRYIGRKPVFAVGNSDGDLDMLRWTDSNSYPSFKMYVHHTDAGREWAYDRDSKIGSLDKGLDEANAKNWHVADMEKDWKVIFPPK